ncbi:hypothetical protein OZN62_01045 [Aurantiacibacter sp. MUD11]|uniref:hypothetical protein n=1 Tax=Aurantiacibacter sp. MUD11 TaxID=3003265 RepID=UPI0022AA7C34|nr:hypothetical protein [Aurantiacibacter sp. MUD11]WAT18195.1 hypothetical protein OZN62_01045 [Aurantiacibacter sp. MUD11]
MSDLLPERMIDMSTVLNAADSKESATNEWESEGGALKQPSAPTELPEGIIAVPTVHYRLGRYSYFRLEDALAEHDRQSQKRTGLSESA